jgi:Fe2+ or Zn2+ uptake regulation protein
MTRQRRLIYDLVCSARDHPTAQDIYARARQVMPAISLGTVYRNLGLLVQEGKIRLLTVPDEPERFDRLDAHDHLICAVCGKIIDCEFSGLSELLKKEAGVEVLSHDLQVRCICRDCALQQQGDSHRQKSNQV